MFYRDTFNSALLPSNAVGPSKGRKTTLQTWELKFGDCAVHPNISGILLITFACACIVKYRLVDSAFKLFLVGGSATPLKNMSSSVGIMKVPIYGQSKKKHGSV